MKRHAWLMVALLIGCGSQPAEEQGRQARPLPGNRVAEATTDFTGFEASARASTNQLQLELKQELAAAMQASGPAHAVEVCSQRAMELTAEVSERTGLDVRRVSIHNRNPANRATPGEASVLAMMAADPDLADTMIVRDGSPLYMRAIRINTPLCLGCHGAKEDLAPDVLARLGELYVDDKATGFADGDLRGAFVVRPTEQ